MLRKRKRRPRKKQAGRIPGTNEDFKFNIGELVLTDDSTVLIEDRTVTRPSHGVAGCRAEAKEPGSHAKLCSMDVSLSGDQGEYATINMNGTADPTARGSTSSWT